MVIVIVGPTGVGKTRLSLELAKKLNGEIINADSTQVYIGLDIATAKIKDFEGVKHHLIDTKDIKEDYTVYNFQTDARKIIDDLNEAGKTPIVVGGTGLYIKALLYNYEFKDEEIRNNYEEYSNDKLYSMLLKVDPNTLIHKNNRQRVVRALNYYDINKKPLSAKEKSDEIVYPFMMIGLKTDRDKLYEIINNRVDNMIDSGLIEEAYSLYKSNVRTKAVMTPIGYKELFEYFDGLISKEEAIDLIKKNSRNYAKRQLTWFNNQMDVTWFDANYEYFDKTIEEVLTHIKKS